MSDDASKVHLVPIHLPSHQRADVVWTPRDIIYPETRDGWRLELKYYPSAVEDEPFPRRDPVVFIPGYGMNTFILGYHPTGASMVEHLCREGFDVWTGNLRGQGGAEPIGGKKAGRIGFRELIGTDIPRILDAVLGEYYAGAHDTVTLMGCSLGATMAYAHLAIHPTSHRVGAVGAIGGPLQWRMLHPLVRLAFHSPALVGSVPIVGTRRLAKTVLPIVKRAPALLSIYMNADHIDLSEAATLAKTVDDPVPFLNRQIAHWLKAGDLEVAGINITEALAHVAPMPLMCLFANKDGVVPPEAALSALDYFPAAPAKVIVAGDDTHWFAHADLFISNLARRQVFEPMTRWLQSLDG